MIRFPQAILQAKPALLFLVPGSNTTTLFERYLYNASSFNKTDLVKQPFFHLSSNAVNFSVSPDPIQ